MAHVSHEFLEVIGCNFPEDDQGFGLTIDDNHDQYFTVEQRI